jgi:Fur family ferric uptake transcriptional regulator
MAPTPAHRASTGERINSSETTGNLTKTLGERGIRLTRQRRLILQVMDDAEQHLDVDQIFARAKQIDSGVHLVTVYRTIELLKKQRLIDELDLLTCAGDRHLLQTHGPRIQHPCSVEVRESAQVWRAGCTEQLKSQIEKDLMKVTISRTEVGGYGAECLANGAS